jgi:protein-L-isoaspartate O-methyltransferase
MLTRLRRAPKATLRAALPSQLGRRRLVSPPADDALLDNYTSEPPSPQLAVDIFAGEWSSHLPDHLKVVSGGSRLFEDSRIDRIIEWVGDIRGMRVLELGPLEGGHTYMLDRAGAVVEAIEANSRAYLKCLVVKELLGLQHARFLRGDFVAYMKQNVEPYDLVLASGVLYHMTEPVELLELLAVTGRRVAIWTHYFDRDVLTDSATAANFRLPAEPVTVDGTTYLMHPRQYLEQLSWRGFGGGSRSYARWMEREDILDLLHRLGFDSLDVSHEQLDHVNGPSFLVLAQRTA